MAVVLCVTLWPRPGRERRLVEYEDAVLALLPEHRARLVARARAAEPGEAAYETQLIELPDQAALEAYLADPRRAALADMRDSAVARTEIQYVHLV